MKISNSDAHHLRKARGLTRASVVAVLVLGLVAVAMPTQVATADSVVLDFSGVAWPAFPGKVATDFEDAILGIVAADYAEYPWLTFAKGVPAAGDTAIEFGQPAGAGSFGAAWIVDWDNKLKAQNNIIAANDAPGSAIDVFVSGFVGSGAPYTDSFARFTTAVGGTASHELGHGLGLRHFDTYGPSPIPGNPNPVPDHHIMATGSTGLAGTDRTDYDRAFSEHSRDKLHYLDPANQPARKRPELAPAPYAHSSFATAEPLTIGPPDLIPAVGREIMTKVASISAPGEADYYSFFGVAGDRIYANTFSSRLSSSSGLGPNPFPVDTVLALHRPDMVTVALNDDIGYNATSSGTPGIGDSEFDAGDGFTKDSLQLIDEIYWAAEDGSSADAPFTSRSTDSIIIDSPSGDYFTLTHTGLWFLEVFPFSSSDTGDYELFVSIERVPEPSTLLLAGVGLVTLLVVRRRRSG